VADLRTLFDRHDKAIRELAREHRRLLERVDDRQRSGGHQGANPIEPNDA
jgi:hypothetical protein